MKSLDSNSVVGEVYCLVLPEIGEAFYFQRKNFIYFFYFIIILIWNRVSLCSPGQPPTFDLPTLACSVKKKKKQTKRKLSPDKLWLHCSCLFSFCISEALTTGYCAFRCWPMPRDSKEGGFPVPLPHSQANQATQSPCPSIPPFFIAFETVFSCRPDWP
jgi:hypothetical protein